VEGSGNSGRLRSRHRTHAGEGEGEPRYGVPFRLNFFFASCEMEAKRSPFRTIFASVCETNKQNFSFISLCFASFCFASFRIASIFGIIFEFFAPFSLVLEPNVRIVF
jgi:hypothetical protein